MHVILPSKIELSNIWGIRFHYSFFQSVRKTGEPSQVVFKVEEHSKIFISMEGKKRTKSWGSFEILLTRRKKKKLIVLILDILEFQGKCLEWNTNISTENPQQLG